MKIFYSVAALGFFIVAKANEINYSSSGSFADTSEIDINKESEKLIKKLSSSKPIQSTIIGFSAEGADVLVATNPGWNKKCHVHGSDARLRLLSGGYYFQTSSFRGEKKLEPGDEFLVPKGTPHMEGTVGDSPAIFITSWNPLPADLNENTVFVDDILCSPEILPKEPAFDRCKREDNYTLPESWTATVLMHPFAPPPQSGEAFAFTDSTPYFQLSVADLFVNSTVFEAHVSGCDSQNSWWYRMFSEQQDSVFVSRDMGKTWNLNDGAVGWKFPSKNWLGTAATCSGSAPLNWATNQDPVDWVKDPYQDSSTWFWFDSQSGFPKRVMYGTAPTTPVQGNPLRQQGTVPLLQMFAFTYFAEFKSGPFTDPSFHTKNPSIDGFACGNPGNLPLIEWNSALSFSAFMVPVDSKSEPLPTTVLYNWANPPELGNAYSRVQVTQMSYEYNLNNALETETAVLFGYKTEDTLSGTGWLIDRYKNATIEGNPICVLGEFIGQQPPNWPVLGQGTVNANIDSSSPLVGNTGSPVTVNSVIFPPVPPYYTNGTYLWTWYADDGGGKQVRPVTFMQSSSTIGEGTSLALADYYGFADWNIISNSTEPINAAMGGFLGERLLDIVGDKDCSSVSGKQPNLRDILSPSVDDPVSEGNKDQVGVFFHLLSITFVIFGTHLL